MSRSVFTTSLAPECSIDQIKGNLTIKGWDLPQIAVEADPDLLEVQEEPDVIRLSCQGDCEIRLPRGTELKIGIVRGDARIKILDESLEIGEVKGSLHLRNVGGAQIGAINGDLSARNIAGNLELGQVKGDVELRQLDGAFQLAEGDGDLDLTNVRLDIHAEIKGDARVRLDLMEGSHYSINAGGDVSCFIPPDAGLKLSLTSLAQTIKVRLPERVETIKSEQADFEIGTGDGVFSISAGGDISLIGQSDGWESGSPFMADFGEEISRQVEAQIGQQMEEVSRRLKEHMERLTVNLDRAGMSPEDAQRIVDQAMRASERETARAQEKMRRAQEKLERKLEEAQRKVEQKARSSERSSWARSRHSWGRGAPMPTSPPPSPASASAPEPVSEEERLMILRMLEQKKISLEEADRLLSALEGNA
jgi:hypothetical protein